jgi:hypothetical protein
VTFSSTARSPDFLKSYELIGIEFNTPGTGKLGNGLHCYDYFVPLQYLVLFYSLIPFLRSRTNQLAAFPHPFTFDVCVARAPVVTAELHA